MEVSGSCVLLTRSKEPIVGITLVPLRDGQVQITTKSQVEHLQIDEQKCLAIWHSQADESIAFPSVPLPLNSKRKRGKDLKRMKWADDHDKTPPAKSSDNDRALIVTRKQKVSNLYTWTVVPQDDGPQKPTTERGAAAKFPNEIFRVVQSPKLPKLLVIAQDGTFSLISATGEAFSLYSTTIATDERIIAAEVGTQGDQVHLYMLISLRKNTGVAVRHFTYAVRHKQASSSDTSDSDSATLVATHTLPIPASQDAAGYDQKNATFSFAVCPNGRHFALFWPNNVVQVYKVVPTDQEETIEQVFLQTFQCAKPANKGPAGIVLLTNAHLFVLTKKKDPQATPVLTAWALQLGSFVGHKDIVYEAEEGKAHLPIKPQDDLLFAICEPDAEFVVVGTSHTVAAVTLQLTQPTLASCFGNMKSATPFIVQRDMFPVVTTPVPVLALAEHDHELPGDTGILMARTVKAQYDLLCDTAKIEIDVISKLIDETATPTLKSFNAILTDYCQYNVLTKEPVAGAGLRAEEPNFLVAKKLKKTLLGPARSSIFKPVSAACAEAYLQLSTTFCEHVAARCVRSGFWTHLEFFSRCPQFSLRMVPDIATALTDNMQLDFIRMLLDEHEGHTDQDLAVYLKFFLSDSEKQKQEILLYVNTFDQQRLEAVLANEPHAKQDPRREDVHSLGAISHPEVAMAKFLNFVITKDKTQNFVLPFLTQLTLPQVTTFINHLAFWIDFHGKHSKQFRNKSYCNIHWILPTMQQVLDWLALILDAHLPVLLIATQDANTQLPILPKLQHIVRQHIKQLKPTLALSAQVNDLVKQASKYDSERKRAETILAYDRKYWARQHPLVSGGDNFKHHFRRAVPDEFRKIHVVQAFNFNSGRPAGPMSFMGTDGMMHSFERAPRAPTYRPKAGEADTRKPRSRRHLTPAQKKEFYPLRGQSPKRRHSATEQQQNQNQPQQQDSSNATDKGKEKADHNSDNSNNNNRQNQRQPKQNHNNKEEEETKSPRKKQQTPTKSHSNNKNRNSTDGHSNKKMNTSGTPKKEKSAGNSEKQQQHARRKSRDSTQ